MGRGKKKNRNRGDWSSDEEAKAAPPPAPAAEQEQGGSSKSKSRKEKRQAKLQQKQQQRKNDDSSDNDEPDIDPMLLLGGMKNQYGSDSEEEGGVEEVVIAQPVSKKKNKKKNKKAAAAFAAFDSSSEEEEDPEESEPESEPEEEIIQKVEDLGIEDSDDEGTKKKAKKDKKKEKKSKKKSKDKDKDGEEKKSVGEDEDLDDEAAKKAAKKAARKAEKAAKEERKRQKALAKLKEIAGEDDKKGSDDDDDDDDGGGDGVMYGAPDDHAWTDKSAAILEAEKNSKKKGDGPDMSLIFGPDGKKLSNKERKKILKQREAEERAKAFEKAAAKASVEGAQFACSQTAINEKDPQWQNSVDINIPSFNISAAGKILFKDASLNIAHGRRYGLVAPNGRGKSTLLKMIASRDLILPPRVDFLYVEQEVVADGTPAVEAVLKADKRRTELIEAEKKLSAKIDAGDEDPKKAAKLQKIYEELEAIGSEAAESKARRILFGLGFDQEMQTKPTKMFSGGWRMRISLARALFIEPTFLCLDEPTNHLDLNACLWLDDYLQKWKKTLLVVSHDQDFMNSVCQEILHIEDLKLCYYKGNYDTFKKQEATKLKQQQIAWEKQEKRLRELKRSGQSRSKAAETVKKSSKREPGARSQKKKQNQAIASGQAAASATELIKRPKEYTVKLEFPEVAELSRPVMEVNNVHFRYSEKHPVIFDKIDFGIDMDSRICVVGPNGAGKSTLLKLLTGEIDAVKGDVRRNPRLRMGIYNQHFVDRLPMNKTPVQHLRDRFQDEDYQSVRNRLGKYGLEGHAHEVVMRDLSGGQKARVVFVELSLQRPHILLLDEPTNNLDIETIDALIDAINEFNGGIVVVTHDVRLIEECECNLWVVDHQKVTDWRAGFDNYNETLLKELEEKIAMEEEKRREKVEAAAASRRKKLAEMTKK
uniref:ABC transporter domain-containing protein n=1 Tax=Leptocylindrus danicus TaxID=163516 RepID=A0A7S2JXI3_9STRA|mmetsp:Transcript_12807/g.19166  ORF Transcript_12807/g.19166 Transcript_12807/m.19166 type:complete len:932 (+) Transcript_12807:84-2879(+)|eukprot:CAMPEP_0116025908 /NCGR_PEP_ID=MMETSP0321-20121206/13428_1 /TAXON_ID=163516 /ORGANISM="Leptocylindrus danicus var. danicus, Strain B650" /LENGTH=931 /DNA_ID=CAMNT_0003498391 /DNA_START=15 /DNA_END=2810 /DNA_ORIENTATION=+